eukprot:1891704-Pyramimonas_sp.AAC.1
MEHGRSLMMSLDRGVSLCLVVGACGVDPMFLHDCVSILIVLLLLLLRHPSLRASLLSTCCAKWRNYSVIRPSGSLI